MVNTNVVAKDYISNLPIYISEEASLKNAIVKLEEFGISRITVTNSAFKIVGTISKKEIAKFLLTRDLHKGSPSLIKIRVKEAMDNSSITIVAYSDTNVGEIYEIMDVLKLDLIPIARSPWDKVLTGVVFFSSIQNMKSDCKMLKQ